MAGGMKDYHRKALKRKRLLLLKEMVPKELLQHLMSEGILTDYMYDKIAAESVPYDQNIALLNLLPKRGPQAFQVFCKALRETEQDHLANQLEEQVVDVDVFATPQTFPPPVQETGPRRMLYESSMQLSNRAAPAQSSEDSIDNGDGPVMVPYCSVEFYRSHYKEAYNLTSCPRGLAIIINNVDFYTPELDSRKGGEVDTASLKQLFTLLRYEVSVHQNLKAQDMRCELAKFSRRSEHARLDSCIVAILSHGVDGAVYGADGHLVQLKEVFSMLDNAHCPQLQNKPKMFFIQACRGEETDRGVDQRDGREQSSSPGCEEMDARKELMKVKLPTQSDMICAYACLRGTVSMRNTKRGSWFVEALMSVFSQHAKDTHVADMLVKVNALIKEREGHAPGTEYHRCKEMSEYCSTLCRKLYLFPGLQP
ncbi:caspase-2 isoform X2 [Spea bombifrons]|uniref:caspase-2 isoform X2 n=1 Tax=Spea bombifrons TaxID=233779 RepID=UPI002349C350|nr:caspase-2 isoform X2 [Spea bombifrons]